MGVVFDVETASNDINRLFSGIGEAFCQMPTEEREECCLPRRYGNICRGIFHRENYYCGPSNERFRRQLYDVYLGGLDMEKFPRLFKRAIPFRMNIRLEDFVKEYICMEQDIEIEGMQESVLQYGRMRSRIESILGEIKWLTKIEENFESYKDKCLEEESWSYRAAGWRFCSLKQDCRKLRTARRQPFRRPNSKRRQRKAWLQRSGKFRKSMKMSL